MARMLGTYNLKHPIVLETRDPSVEDATREEVLRLPGFCVTMRRPKGKDLLVFDRHEGAPMAAVTEMIERLTQLDAIEVANLDGEDFGELGNLLERFAPNGPATGATVSAP